MGEDIFRAVRPPLPRFAADSAWYVNHVDQKTPCSQFYRIPLRIPTLTQSYTRDCQPCVHRPVQADAAVAASRRCGPPQQPQKLKSADRNQHIPCAVCDLKRQTVRQQKAVSQPLQPGIIRCSQRHVLRSPHPAAEFYSPGGQVRISQRLGLMGIQPPFSAITAKLSSSPPPSHSKKRHLDDCARQRPARAKENSQCRRRNPLTQRLKRQPDIKRRDLQQQPH